jgi:hypothetical protein
MATGIEWKSQIELSLKEAKASQKYVLLDFSHAPQ